MQECIIHPGAIGNDLMIIQVFEIAWEHWWNDFLLKTGIFISWMEFIITTIKVAKSILFHCNTFLYYLQYLNKMISRDEYSSVLTLNKNMGVVGNLA